LDAGGSFPEVQQLNAKFTIHLHQVRVKNGEAMCEGEGQFRLHILNEVPTNYVVK
jgi:hypothetical protein